MSVLQKNTIITSILLSYGVLWFNFPEMAIAITLAAGAIGYSSFYVSGNHTEDYEFGQPAEQDYND